MGISHEYHSTSHRARHGGVSGKLRLAGAVLAILVLAYAITAILENGASAKDAQSEPVASGIAQDILAPLPMQGEAADSDSSAKNITAQAPDEDQPVNQELLDFFDAMDEKNYDLMLECLTKLQTHATQKELDDICMVLDIHPPVSCDDVGSQIMFIKRHLAMIRKFDGERLR